MPEDEMVDAILAAHERDSSEICDLQLELLEKAEHLSRRNT